jgi:predicted molibdopterin-dependent oxidoreductase YjgC
MDNNYSARLPMDENVERGEKVEIAINGEKVVAHLGESVATALMCQGISAMRTTIQGEPRGVFCGMGVCFDCLVVVDGIPNTRSCVTWVSEGMVISTQNGLS